MSDVRKILDQMAASEERRAASGEGHLVPPVLIEEMRSMATAGEVQKFCARTGITLTGWQRRLLDQIYTPGHDEEQNRRPGRGRRLADRMRRIVSARRKARG